MQIFIIQIFFYLAWQCMNIFRNYYQVLSKLHHNCEFTFWYLQNSWTTEAVTGGAPVKKVSLVAKFTGKHLLWSLFFNKVARLRSVKLLKERLRRKYFPVNFEKFLRTPFLPNTSGQLLLLILLLNTKTLNSVKKTFQ